MKPELRQQLFERWKELGKPQEFGYFQKHMQNGLIHVSMDGVESLFTPRSEMTLYGAMFQVSMLAKMIQEYK